MYAPSFRKWTEQEHSFNYNLHVHEKAIFLNNLLPECGSPSCAVASGPVEVCRSILAPFYAISKGMCRRESSWRKQLVKLT